jgi:hypothetical protein
MSKCTYVCTHVALNSNKECGVSMKPWLQVKMPTVKLPTFKMYISNLSPSKRLHHMNINVPELNLTLNNVTCTTWLSPSVGTYVTPEGAVRIDQKVDFFNVEIST